MIDINELRRLTQAATPGPWKIVPVGDGRQKFAVADSEFLSIVTVADEGGATFGTVYEDADAEFIAAANPAAINELLDRLEAAESECLEEARLNGMGSEREAALMAKLEAAEKERDALRATLEDERKEHSYTLRAARAEAKQVDALRAELAQLHKEADKFGDGIDWIQRALQAEAQIEALELERDALRAAVRHEADCVEAAKAEIAALRAAQQLALEVLENVRGNINPERGYADELEADVERAIAAIARPAPTIAEQDQSNAEAAVRSIYGAQPAPSVQDVPAKSLKPVIDWLRNGCDPMEAAEELEILIAAAPEAKHDSTDRHQRKDARHSP